jgi:hypothetical protein
MIHSSCRTAWNQSASYVPFGTYYTEEVLDPKTRALKDIGLKSMRGYDIAKNGGRGHSQKDQIAAAQDVIDALLFKGGHPTAFYKRLKAAIEQDPDCVIIAPSLSGKDPHNVLPITFAHILAEEFDRTVCETVFQKPKDKSKRLMDGLERLSKDTGFYGLIEKGRSYFIVDDVMTMGGTIAALKGYIESQGGEVSGFAVLADGTKELHRRADIAQGIPLAPAPQALEKLENTFHNDTERLSRIFKGVTGHGHKELTARETEFVGKKYQGDFVRLRNALLGTADPRPS